MLVGVAIFMAAFVKCCAVHTPSSNPNKKPALRLSDTLQHTLRRKVSHLNPLFARLCSRVPLSLKDTLVLTRTSF